MKHNILFVSGNDKKLADIIDVAGNQPDFTIEHYSYIINEPQNSSLEEVVMYKLKKAFNYLRRPVFVDHACLHLSAFNGFPGSNSGAFWNHLGEDMCSIVSKLGDNKAKVEVGIGYADAYSMSFFSSNIDGIIPDSPRGERDFSWDRVFIPNEKDKTFAEMSVSEKNSISPRAKAFEEMINYINQRKISI